MASQEQRGWFPTRRGLIVLVLVGLPLVVTVSAIEAARWVSGLPSLIALALIPLPLWALLSGRRVPWWIGHPVALLAGVGVGFLLGAYTLQDASGPRDLASQLGEWFGAVGSSGGNKGEAMMGVFLIALTLWMGYATVWLAYRRSLAVLSTLPGLGVLLVVLTFLPTDFYWYFFMYLLAAAPGIAYRHKGHWSGRGRQVRLAGSILGGAVLMGATVAPVWNAPAPEGIVLSLDSQFGDPWYKISNRWSDLFHGVPDRKDWPFFSPPEDLPFGGPIDPKDDLLFVVESDAPYRWRMRVYDTYTGSGWTNGGPRSKVAAEEVPLEEYVEPFRDREQVEIGVRIYSKANALVTVGEPVKARIPATVELSPQPDFRLYLLGSQVSYLPPEVEEHRGALIDWLIDGHPPPDPDSPLSDLEETQPEPVPEKLLDLGFALAPPSDGATDPYLSVHRLEPTTEPPVALLSQRILVPYYKYHTVGSLSHAKPFALRTAGQDYPDWVSDRYLQLPNDFPRTVRRLAADLTKGRDNPYDMAEAIRRHLITLPYSLDVRVPPPGKDWVEFFLLEERRGYCQNYASAMITMLRSQGIPARLAVGFAPGFPDPAAAEWTVQTKHYHAWPEAFFPGYGWVEFEPTPADVQDALRPLGIVPVGGLATNDVADVDSCPQEIFFEGCIDSDGAQSLPDDLLNEALDSGTDPTDTGVRGARAGYLTSPWSLLGLILGLGLVGGVSYVWWSGARLGHVDYAYSSMAFLGRLAGVAQRSQETPQEYSARLTRVIPDRAEAVSQITRKFVISRYSGSRSHPYGQEMWGLRSAWSRVRNGLVRRILSRLIPRRG